MEQGCHIRMKESSITYIYTYIHTHVYACAGYDLSISGGSDGARLSHSHEREFYYVHICITYFLQNEEEGSG